MGTWEKQTQRFGLLKGWGGEKNRQNEYDMIIDKPPSLSVVSINIALFCSLSTQLLNMVRLKQFDRDWLLFAFCNVCDDQSAMCVITKANARLEKTTS